MKIAVYVEGKTELIFLCHFLRKWFDNDPSKVCIRYWELDGVRPIKNDLTFGDSHSLHSYAIINAGNDDKSLSEALKSASNQKNIGFDKVLVLRDMYSEKYKEGIRRSAIDKARNDLFIQFAQRAIDDRNLTDFVHCHFAIMEIEAWILGMGWYLQKVDPILTPDYLLSALKLDLNKDPEICFYHPTKRLKKIYGHIGSYYSKREDQVISIMSHLEKPDFQLLLDLNKCASFNAFVGNLTN